MSEEPQLNSRQIALLRDFRMDGFMAFFDSPFRLEGVRLRELGMFEGVGDNTCISAAGWAVLAEADATITRNVARAKGQSHE